MYILFPVLIKHTVDIHIYIPEPVASVRRYRAIWHLSEVHSALIQLLNNSEEEKTVYRPAGERNGSGGLNCDVKTN